jgi:hypothetical protein
MALTAELDYLNSYFVAMGEVMDKAKKIAVVILSLVSLISSPVHAWDGSKAGKVTGIDLTGGQNFGFRVYMDGTPMCGTTESWAYVNKDFDNYDAFVSVITTAYFSGKPITLITTKVGTYCQIGYVQLR